MKKFLVVGFALLASALNAAWKYDPDAKTLTDGVLIFNATLANDNELSIDATDGRFVGDSVPDAFSIDFRTISDADDKQYAVVKFGDFSHASGNYFKAYAGRLTEFIAPDCKNIFGNGCFSECSQMTKVEVNKDISFSHDRPFFKCSKLSDFTPRTMLMTLLRTEFFLGCSSLSGEFNLPNCTTIATKAFSGCSSLEKVSIPKVTAINGNAFDSCASLQEVVVSDSLDIIGSTAFSGCTSLRGDSIRSLLHPGITMLGTNHTNIKTIFENCSSFDGSLEWDFPNITIYKYNGVSYPINLVGQRFFLGCSKLEKVVFKTPVLEIGESAFNEIAPGAEVYLHKEVAEVYGKQAVARATAPFPKVFLPDPIEPWLQTMGVSNFLLEKKDFRNTSWEKKINASDSTKTGYWKDIAAMMMTDAAMCGKETIDGTDYPVLLDKRIVAFVYFTNSSTRGNGCWVLRMSKNGFTIKVR